VRAIRKAFAGAVVLAGLDLDVHGGEIVVVLGPSGSGKTTLLRILAGLETPDAGTVIVDGADATLLPPQRREFGVVFQEQALFGRMTVEGNIAFGLEVHGAREREVAKTVDEMLDLTGLRPHRRKLPSQLSGGQRQRVAVARALAASPRAMLFDEPFSALDPVTRTELRREVRMMLKAVAMPALFITHDQEEALELADRVAILNRGVIEQVGTPYEVYNRPGSEFVATFLGAANVLYGRWRRGQIHLGGLRLAAPADAGPFEERQSVKLVFRPEDAVLNFQPQLLDAPWYLGTGVVEEVTYAGPVERLVIRLGLSTRSPELPGAGAESGLPSDPHEPWGVPVTVTRTKWEASEMELEAGDPVTLGLKGCRVLPHFPLRSESAGKVVG
jgi:ABC-type Fe3+/spermidine/putrescine transport system ATPase subunit